MDAKAMAGKAVAVVMAMGILASGASWAGDVNGPGCVNERVRSNRTDVYRIVFEGHRPAFVSIRGDRDTDLDLEIRDSDGRPVCMADGHTDREACRWRPGFTQEYTVRVHNLGSVYNDYRLCTN